MKLRAGLLTIVSLVASWQCYASNFYLHDADTITDPNQLLGSQKAITTAVPFLSISPDARHAALGDAGVATSPDANSTYWNAAKLVFIDKAY